MLSLGNLEKAAADFSWQCWSNGRCLQQAADALVLAGRFRQLHPSQSHPKQAKIQALGCGERWGLRLVCPWGASYRPVLQETPSSKGLCLSGVRIKGDHLVWPRRADTPLHKLFLENGSPSPSCNSSWQRQCKWLWDNKRGLCLQGRNKNANIFGMKKQRRFTPWYFLSVLCICLCFTFSFLSFGLSKCSQALGSDGGWRGPVGGTGLMAGGCSLSSPGLRSSAVKCFFPHAVCPLWGDFPCSSLASERAWPCLAGTLCPGTSSLGLSRAWQQLAPGRASPSSWGLLHRSQPKCVAGV